MVIYIAQQRPTYCATARNAQDAVSEGAQGLERWRGFGKRSNPDTL
jgi:hypothetical protein